MKCFPTAGNEPPPPHAAVSVHEIAFGCVRLLCPGSSCTKSTVFVHGRLRFRFSCTFWGYLCMVVAFFRFRARNSFRVCMAVAVVVQKADLRLFV